MSYNPDLGNKYRRTSCGWEPVDAWRPMKYHETEFMRQAREKEKTEALIFRLVMETAALGVPLKDAVKWWDYIISKSRKTLKEEKHAQGSC